MLHYYEIDIIPLHHEEQLQYSYQLSTGYPILRDSQNIAVCLVLVGEGHRAARRGMYESLDLGTQDFDVECQHSWSASTITKIVVAVGW